METTTQGPILFTKIRLDYDNDKHLYPMFSAECKYSPIS